MFFIRKHIHGRAFIIKVTNTKTSQEIDSGRSVPIKQQRRGNIETASKLILQNQISNIISMVLGMTLLGIKLEPFFHFLKSLGMRSRLTW